MRYAVRLQPEAQETEPAAPLRRGTQLRAVPLSPRGSGTPEASALLPVEPRESRPGSGHLTDPHNNPREP